MGDPKKFRKKYETPIHPWNKKQIDEEKILVKEYGLAKKKEIMVAEHFLKKYMGIAKRLIASQTAQGKVEKKQVLNKLQGLGLISVNAELDNLLGLELKDVLERRLQSIVYRLGLAHSMKQARQFIVHRHIMVGDKEITAPSYLVSLSEENKIMFKPKSSLADEEHPERINPAAQIKEEIESIKKTGAPKNYNDKEADAAVVEKSEEEATKKAEVAADKAETKEETAEVKAEETKNE